MEDVIIKALIAGTLLALVAGPLGCLIIWRRMAYFGDSLAHTALLGIALGIIAGINVNLGIVIACSLFATLLIWLQHKKILTTDSLLGILAHSGLAIGMIALSLAERNTSDHSGHHHDEHDFDGHEILHQYLFGDVLNVTTQDIYWIVGGVLAVAIFLLKNWNKLTLMTINEDLAKAEGIKTFHLHIFSIAALTIIVAVSIQIIGILLITSLLIIPAAAARQVSLSSKSMAIYSSILGLVSVVIGIFASLEMETPSGPTIVCVATILFIVSIVLSSFKAVKNSS